VTIAKAVWPADTIDRANRSGEAPSIPEANDPSVTPTDLKQELRRRRDLYAESGAPKMHRDVLVSPAWSGWWDPELVDEAIGELNSGRIVAVLGGRDKGKTTFATHAAREFCLGRGQSARYAIAMEFLERLKFGRGTGSTFGGGQRSAADTARRVIDTAGLLILDELQDGLLTEADQRHLGYLINQRYSAELPLLLIGNMSRTDFESAIGASALSRMLQRGAVYLFDDAPGHRHANRAAPATPEAPTPPPKPSRTRTRARASAERIPAPPVMPPEPEQRGPLSMGKARRKAPR